MLNNFVFKCRKCKQLDKFHEAWLKFATLPKLMIKNATFGQSLVTQNKRMASNMYKNLC